MTSVARFVVRPAGDEGTALPAVPILKSEPSDARKFPRIARHDLEPSPQGAGREQQMIGSDGRALTVGEVDFIGLISVP